MANSRVEPDLQLVHPVVGGQLAGTVLVFVAVGALGVRGVLQTAGMEDVAGNLVGLVGDARADVHVEVGLPVLAGGHVALQILLVDGRGLLAHHLGHLFQLLGGEGVVVFAVLVAFVIAMVEGRVFEKSFTFGLVAVAAVVVLAAVVFAVASVPVLAFVASVLGFVIPVLDLVASVPVLGLAAAFTLLFCGLPLWFCGIALLLRGLFLRLVLLRLALFRVGLNVLVVSYICVCVVLSLRTRSVVSAVVSSSVVVVSHSKKFKRQRYDFFV